MRRSWITCFAATLIWSSASSHDEASTSRPSDIEEVVVTGEQPGPSLWKATKNGHVLWVYGTVTPKPRDITWRSKQVAQVLDATQEVIDQQLQGTSWPANIDLGLDTRNPVKLFGTGRKLRKIQQAHAPPPLREVVPADLYARFLRLKNRYMPGNDEIEHWRPRFAASSLYAAAIDSTRLTSRAMIHDEVHRLARRRRVKVSDVTFDTRVDMETLEQIYTEFNQIPPSAELECFEETISQIENELHTITARANAWAIGDVSALRKLPSLRLEACDRARWSTPRWSNLDADLQSLWLETVDAAVSKNQATLVLVDVAEIFEAGGLISGLIERGYDVEEPDGSRIATFAK